MSDLAISKRGEVEGAPSLAPFALEDGVMTLARASIEGSSTSPRGLSLSERVRREESDAASAIREKMESTEEGRTLFTYLSEQEKQSIALHIAQVAQKQGCKELLNRLLRVIHDESYQPDFWLDPIFSYEDVDALVLMLYLAGKIKIEELATLHTMCAALRDCAEHNTEVEVIPLFLENGEVNPEARRVVECATGMEQKERQDHFFKAMRDEAPMNRYLLHKKVEGDPPLTVISRILTIQTNLLYNVTHKEEEKFTHNIVAPFRAIGEVIKWGGGPHCPKPAFHYGFGDPLIMREEHMRGERTVTVVPSFAPLAEMVADGFPAPGECMPLHDFYHNYVMSFIPPSHLVWFMRWAKELESLKVGQPAAIQQLVQSFIDHVIDSEFVNYRDEGDRAIVLRNEIEKRVCHFHTFSPDAEVIKSTGEKQKDIVSLMTTLLFMHVATFLQKEQDIPEDLSTALRERAWFWNPAMVISASTADGRFRFWNANYGDSRVEEKRVEHYLKRHQEGGLANDLTSFYRAAYPTVRAIREKIDATRGYADYDEGIKEQFAEILYSIIHDAPPIGEKLASILLHIKEARHSPTFWETLLSLDENLTTYTYLLYLGGHIEYHDLTFLVNIRIRAEEAASAGLPFPLSKRVPLFLENGAINFEAWLLIKNIPELRKGELRSAWFSMMKSASSLNHDLFILDDGDPTPYISSYGEMCIPRAKRYCEKIEEKIKGPSVATPPER